MQKLTYINLHNEQMVLSVAPFVLEKITGLGMADIDYETLRGAYQQGDTAAGFRRASRAVTATFALLATSRADLYAKRQSLLGILSPDRARKGSERARIIYENDFGRWVTYAVPEGGLEPAKRIRDVQPGLKVTFRCESPYWYAMAEEEVEFSYGGGGFTLPFSFPISFGTRDYSKEALNSGHVDAPVQIWIACKGEIPRIVNKSTGKSLALSSAVPDGYTLYVNTDPGRLEATLTDPNGVVTGAFGRLSLDTPMADFVLRPGLNTLVYEAGGAGAQSIIKVRWRAAFEGV